MPQRSRRAGARTVPSSWRRSFLYRELRLPLRYDAQHHPMRRDEIGPHGLLHRCSSHPAIPVQVLLEVVRRADEVVVLIQLVRLPPEPAHPLEARQELSLESVLRALHLTRRRPAVAELLHLFVDYALELREVVPGSGRGPELELPVDAATVLEGDHVGGDLEVVHETTVQARRSAAREHVGDHVEGGVVTPERLHGVPRVIDAW